MAQPHSLMREGLITGILGASAVALWFLIVDTISGTPLYTPTALGAALFQVDLGSTDLDLGLVLGYTLFHYLAFIATGMLAVRLVHLGEQQPELLVLLLIFFVVFEMGFYGLVAVFHETHLLNGMEWYQIAIGNLLASILMGGYLWRSHPALRPALDRALSH